MVDDEPDVLSVTKLALKDVKVHGLPIKVYAAKSKAAAIELLGKPPFVIVGEAHGSLAVAFIDVVMESQSAGLELCAHIRETRSGSSRRSGLKEFAFQLCEECR